MKRIAPAGLRLCAALAFLTLALFPACLNPRPEEDPSVTIPVGSVENPGAAGASAGGSGAGGPVVDMENPDEDTSAPPVSDAPDAGTASDAGVPRGDAGSSSGADSD